MHQCITDPNQMMAVCYVALSLFLFSSVALSYCGIGLQLKDA